MKTHWVLGTLVIVVVAVSLVIASGGYKVRANVQEAQEAKSVLAPAATLVVTSTADSGAGTLRQALCGNQIGTNCLFGK